MRMTELRVTASLKMCQNCKIFTRDLKNALDAANIKLGEYSIHEIADSCKRIALTTHRDAELWFLLNDTTTVKTVVQYMALPVTQ